MLRSRVVFPAALSPTRTVHGGSSPLRSNSSVTDSKHRTFFRVTRLMNSIWRLDPSRWAMPKCAMGTASSEPPHSNTGWRGGPFTKGCYGDSMPASAPPAPRPDAARRAHRGGECSDWGRLRPGSGLGSLVVPLDHKQVVDRLAPSAACKALPALAARGTAGRSGVVRGSQV